MSLERPTSAIQALLVRTSHSQQSYFNQHEQVKQSILNDIQTSQNGVTNNFENNTVSSPMEQQHDNLNIIASKQVTNESSNTQRRICGNPLLHKNADCNCSLKHKVGISAEVKRASMMV